MLLQMLKECLGKKISTAKIRIELGIKFVRSYMSEVTFMQ